MKPEVLVNDGKVVVRARKDDAVARARRINLTPNDDGTTRRLSDAERDVILVAIWQMLQEKQQQRPRAA